VAIIQSVIIYQLTYTEQILIVQLLQLPSGISGVDTMSFSKIDKYFVPIYQTRKESWSIRFTLHRAYNVLLNSSEGKKMIPNNTTFLSYYL